MMTRKKVVRMLTEDFMYRLRDDVVEKILSEKTSGRQLNDLIHRIHMNPEKYEQRGGQTCTADQ